MTQDQLLREAFSHHSALNAYAYSVLRDWDLAEDCVQEAMLTVNKKWQDYDPSQRVFPWIKGIVRFKCLELIRARRKELFFGDEDLMNMVEEAFADSIDEEFVRIREGQMKALKHCMARLNESNLTMLLKFYREKESCESIASLSKPSVNAIYISLTRIRQKVRDCTRSFMLSEQES